MIGMVVSPKTGQKVLAKKKLREGDFVRKDIIIKGTKTLICVPLEGNIGDRFNYVTLENYGQGEVYPVPISKKRKRR